jgi:hypothetical protein
VSGSTRLSDFKSLAKLKDVRPTAAGVWNAKRMPNRVDFLSTRPFQGNQYLHHAQCLRWVRRFAVTWSHRVQRACQRRAGASFGSSAGGVGGALEVSPAGSGARAVDIPRGRADGSVSALGAL